MVSTEPTGRSPRRRRGVFADLAAGCAVMGVAIGLVFPYFVVAMGVPEQHVLHAAFRTACLMAGLLAGGLAWVLARRLVGAPLRALSDRLTRTAEALSATARFADWSGFHPAQLRLGMPGEDDLARAAGAFDEMLVSLEHEQWFRSVVGASSDVVIILDRTARVEFASPSVLRALGWPAETLLGLPATDLVHPADRHLVDSMTGPDAGAGTDAVVLRTRAGTGDPRWVEVAVSDCRADDRIAGLVVTARDVTERHELQSRMAHQAAHDQLTGLPNRSALLSRGAMLLESLPEDGWLAVLMIDLDRFKEVNDTLGHSYGDQLLEQVGPRLRSRLRDHDVLARLGGDEFALALPGLDVSEAAALATRLARAMTEPFLVDGLALDVEAGIGVAVGRAPDAIESLLRQADIAMYAAKERGTGIECYDEAGDLHSTSRLVLLSELRRGIAEGQLLLHFQPQVRVSDGRVVAVEALVRWQHPERGLLLPAAFLPQVEPTGLMASVTSTVLDLALAQVRRWLDDGLAVPISVNISAHSLAATGLTHEVLTALESHDVPAALLRLELTESAVLTRPEQAMRIMRELHEAGVGLSIDDFGNGYSSMAYLRDLPLDELKIDRGFVTEMTTCERDLSLVRSSIDLAHSLGLRVVAEGVERPETVAALQDLACDAVQGFHLGRPAEAPAVTAELLAQAARQDSDAVAERRGAAGRARADRLVPPGSSRTDGAAVS